MKKPSPLRALDQAREAAITSDLPPGMGVAFVHEINGTDAVLVDPKLFAALLLLADSYAESVDRTTEWAILNEIEGDNLGW